MILFNTITASMFSLVLLVFITGFFIASACCFSIRVEKSLFESKFTSGYRQDVNDTWVECAEA